MAANSELITFAAGHPSAVGHGGYISRQPILDVRSVVHAYELLFAGETDSGTRSDEQRTCSVIDNTVLYGLSWLTAGLPAFVRCTAATLSLNLVDMLPSGTTVLEVPSQLWIRDDIQSKCKELRSAGYRFAIELSAWKPEVSALLPLAAYVKIDFAAMDFRDRREAVLGMRHSAVAPVAKNIETQAQFQQARAEGFNLMQGYYFCRPMLLESRQIPPNRLTQIEILRMLNDESIHFHRLTELVKRDASLTFRLLRLINSPICAMQQEVYSVQSALLAVGEEIFRRMATVAITSDLNTGQPSELLRMAFVRGRFCELASFAHGMDCSEQYLLGLLSLLPAMLRVEMNELAPSLPVREEIRLALLGQKIEERKLLTWLERYETGDWFGCQESSRLHSLNEADLLRSYQEAVAWTESALHFA